MSWTTEKHARLVELAAQGLSVKNIAAELGMTRNAIIGRARREGVALLYRPPAAEPRPPRDPRERGHRYGVDVKERARQLYSGGATYASIMAATGIPLGYISQVCRGLPRRRPEAPKAKRYDFAFKVAAVAAVLTGESYRRASERLGPEERSIIVWSKREDVRQAAEAIAARVKAAHEAEQKRQRQIAEEEAEAERIRAETANAPILATMPPRHRAICERRVAGQTLQQIGDAFGVTSERIRQIEVRWRMQGLIVPGARPLNEVAARKLMDRLHVSGGGRRPKAKPYEPLGCNPFELAHDILDGRRKRRPMRLTPEERQRRAEHMRRVAASQKARKYGVTPGMAPA